MAIITLTTDFGSRDAYVAAMKGVIYGITEEVRLVDVTHDVPPQDVREAAHLLAEVVPVFPGGTVHLAVVDPGVGGSRRAIAIETETAFFVGPDNGLFTPSLGVTRLVRAVELEEPRFRRVSVAATFHGRDIFAPAAAHLARGVDLAELGPPVSGLVALVSPAPVVGAGVVEGEVVHVDRFGNLVTNITLVELPMPVRAVELGFVEVHELSRTYADVTPGTTLALIGSSGRLEISVREGSAAQRLGVRRGAKVVVRGEPSSR